METKEIAQSVLIVDDSSINIKVLTNIISPLGYTIHTAKSGLNALKFLIAHKPDLILMDIKMPRMDGFECCTRIKSISRRSEIPVIFISGSHDAKDKQKAAELGACAYLTKPVNPVLLLKAMGEESIYNEELSA